jgi:hypothetical protein
MPGSFVRRSIIAGSSSVGLFSFSSRMITIPVPETYP